MTQQLKFHWFLPTNGGDGRQVVGGGHGVDAFAGGRPASTPVGVIVDGTMPTERTVLSTLGSLADDLAAHRVVPPAIIVIGDVVAVARPEHYTDRGPARG